MADSKNDLILYLKLDDMDTEKKTVPDSSSSKIDGKVHGASLAADDIFGACLSFDRSDDKVDVSDTGLTGTNPAHTIEAWIRVDKYPQTRAWILLLGQPGGGSHHWLLNPENAGNMAKKAQLGVWLGEQFQPEIPLGQWVHLATTYADGKLNAYVNGAPIGEPKAATFTFTEKRLTLAGRGILSEKNFEGKIACLRLYRKALTVAEIKEDMDADKMALPAYRDAHPIAFSLYDESENYVLYINDDPNDEQRLTLELRNTSARAINFIKKGNDASTDNYHFELVFRSGALSEKTINLFPQHSRKILQKTETEHWDVYSSGEDRQSHTTSLYFLKKNISQDFSPNHRLLIRLQNISAAAGAGARGTRIELRPHQLTYVDDTVPITGTRMQHLQIINHLGSRRMPLHVGFVGSHRILNDGVSANSLALQLMNVLRSEQQETTITLNPDTEFLMSFDVEATSRREVAPWSLCTEEEIKSLQTDDSIIVAKIEKGNVVFSDGKPVSDTGQWSVTRTDKGQGESPVWKISPKTNLVLKRDDYILIYIANIRTSLPSGLTNLYLDYKNIPGFWEGQVVCTIEKAPLLFHPGVDLQGKPERHVGINTLNPKNALDVKGTVAIGKTYAANNRAPDGTDLLVEGKVGIGTTVPGAKLSVMGGVHIGGTSDPGNNNLQIEGDASIGHNLKFSNVAAGSDVSIYRVAATSHDKGNVPSSLSLHTYDGGHAGVWIKNERRMPEDNGNNQYICFHTHEAWRSLGERMRIAPNGNVGIGATAPTAKLTVMGGVNIGGTSDPGANNLYVEGKVGIGATGSEAKLDINGDIIIRGVIKGKYSDSIDLKKTVDYKKTNDYLIHSDAPSPMNPQMVSLGRVVGQQAAIIQGFGATTSTDLKSYPPHLFAIGYHKGGTMTNSAVIIDLTTGAISGLHKSFIIEHPLYENKYLMHATLEGPEGAVYYRGTARLRNGRAEIQLPDYFESLTHLEERTILLTNLDGFDQLAVLKQDGVKIKKGLFIVVSSNKESSQEFDWEVKAVRKDVEKLDVEPSKDAVKVERFGPYAYAMPKKDGKKE